MQVKKRAEWAAKASVQIFVGVLAVAVVLHHLRATELVTGVGVTPVQMYRRLLGNEMKSFSGNVRRNILAKAMAHSRAGRRGHELVVRSMVFVKLRGEAADSAEVR